MSVVICDALPIIALAFLGHLEYLHVAFGEIIIPSRVAQEVAIPRLACKGLDAATVDWIVIRDPTSTQVVSSRFERLHPGEIAAISLALETNAALLVVDEAAARSAAKVLGLPITGTIGLFLRMKASGAISAIRRLLDRLRRELNFFIADELYLSVLESAEE